jgi:hypothetical protein
MEIGKRYRFRERLEVDNHEIGNLANKEFYLTGMGRINVHYQVVGTSRIRTLPKMFWDIYVQGEAPDIIQGDSKLIFKFI